MFTEALSCYDGSDCLQTNSCEKCNGIGCMRIRSYNTEHLHAIALTCLPFATRSYQLQPAGCQISLSGDGEYCICYDVDYCNQANSLSALNFPLIIIAFIFLQFLL